MRITRDTHGVRSIRIPAPAKDPAMSTTVYSLSLARSENGNWSLTPSANLLPQLPPMAFPAHLSALEARDYTDGMLVTARVPAPSVLAWHVYGHTAHDHSPAYRASWSVSVQSLSPAL